MGFPYFSNLISIENHTSTTKATSPPWIPPSPPWWWPTPAWTALTWRSTPPHRLSLAPLHLLQSRNSDLLPPWVWVLKTYRGWSSISTDRVIKERSRTQMIIDLTNSTSTSWHPDLVGGLPAGPTLTLWEFSQKSETVLYYSFYIHNTSRVVRLCQQCSTITASAMCWITEKPGRNNPPLPHKSQTYKNNNYHKFKVTLGGEALWSRLLVDSQW